MPLFARIRTHGVTAGHAARRGGSPAATAVAGRPADRPRPQEHPGTAGRSPPVSVDTPEGVVYKSARPGSCTGRMRPTASWYTSPVRRPARSMLAASKAKPGRAGRRRRLRRSRQRGIGHRPPYATATARRPWLWHPPSGPRSTRKGSSRARQVSSGTTSAGLVALHPGTRRVRVSVFWARDESYRYPRPGEPIGRTS